MKINILEANKDDLPELSLLWEKMIHEVLPYTIPKRDWWIKYINAFMLHNDYKCYKAVIDDVIVGFADGSLFADPSVGKIVAMGLNFYVLPEYRKGIIGTRLYLKLAHEGKKRGAEIIQLICYGNSLTQWKRHGMTTISSNVRKEL